MASYRKVSIAELTPGSVLAAPVFDKNSTKLLDAGAIVDQHLVDRLEALGITEVVVESTDESVRVRLEGSTIATTPINRCSSCGNLISIQPPAPDLKVCTWHCETCGAVYFGGSDDGGTASRGVIRADPAVHNPFVASVAPSIPPENVQRLMKSLVSVEYSGLDYRRNKRYPVTVPVVALPLSEDFRINGELVQMTTANISLGGAALIHTRFVDAPYLALDFTVAGVELLQVVLKVLRVRNIGLVYEVGGEFMSRLSPAPK